jgi:Zn-dependent protease with chaperone function
LLTNGVLILSAMAHFVAAGLLMALANWTGLLAWRRAAGAHWTERARLLWPVRCTAAFGVVVIPFLLMQVHGYLLPAFEPNWIVDAVASFGGALLGSYPLDRQVYPQLDFGRWRRQAVAWWGVRFGIWGVLLAAILLMPEEPGWRMLAVAGGCLALQGLLLGGVFLRYLRLVGFLSPAGPRLQQIVDAAAARLGGVKVRATWEMGGCVANAFAFPTTRELVFSRRMLEVCSDDEVSAICAHELGHLQESKWILAARLAGSFAMFPLIFINPAVHAWGLLGWFIPYAIMLVVLRCSRLLSQRMEKRADEVALQDQANEGVYARALEKLYRENQSPAVGSNNRQTHPHLYDRMVAAGITPDFPRPGRPRRFTIVGWGFIVAGGVLLGLAFANH